MKHLTKHDFNEPRHQSQSWRTVAYPAPRVRVTIQHDDSPMDPFEMGDGHWPMLVRNGDHYSSVTEKVVIGKEIPQNLNKSMQQWFTPEGLIHNQHHIYKILDGAAEYQDQIYGCKHTNDPDIVWAVMDEYEVDEDNFEKREELYELAGVLCHRETVCGCVQSEWAEVLIVAPAETIVKLRGACDEATVRKGMEAQAQIYEDWAFGNCYGYTVEILPWAIGNPDDAIEEDWEDVPDGSCWGYFGDHDTSGILDQINEVLRYEPVRSLIEAYAQSDNLTEVAA